MFADVGQGFAYPAKLGYFLIKLSSVFNCYIYLIKFVTWNKKHYISFHCFAADLQKYPPIKTNSKDSMQALLNCFKKSQNMDGRAAQYIEF